MKYRFVYSLSSLKQCLGLVNLGASASSDEGI